MNLMLMVATVKESLPRKEARLKGRLRRWQREAHSRGCCHSSWIQPGLRSETFPSQKGYKSRGPDVTYSDEEELLRLTARLAVWGGDVLSGVISMGREGRVPVSPHTPRTQPRGLETKS